MTEFADIRSYIDQLVPALGGVRPPHDRNGLSKLYSTRTGPSQRGDYQGMVFFIAHSLGLFENQVIVIGQIVDSTGPNGVPFWVSAPLNKNDYRLPDDRKTRVKVFLSRDLVSRCSFERAVVGIARELSHVVLYMNGHPLRHDEKAVDLAAMILGYRPFYFFTPEEHAVPKSPRARFLNTDEVRFACDYIEGKEKSAAEPLKVRGIGIQEKKKSAAELLGLPSIEEKESSPKKRSAAEQQDSPSTAKLPDVPFS